MTSPARPPQPTGGFTLVEVLVSLMILSVGTVALSALLLRSARQATAASALVYQTAALTTEVGRLGALPFDQLAAGNTCVNVTTGPFLHTRCAAIVDVSAKVKRVTVTVTPTGPTLLAAQSTAFERAITGTSNGTNPLNTP
jgi:prepilin-type N-terminal cleavage/methylation domain-containing protein